MLQDIIVYIIIAIVAILVMRYILRLFRKPKDVSAKCAGCPLSEACQSKDSNKGFGKNK